MNIGVIARYGRRTAGCGCDQLTEPSIRQFLLQQNETKFHRTPARIVKSGPATGFITNRDESISFGTGQRDYLPGLQLTALAPSPSRSSTRSPRWFATLTALGRQEAYKYSKDFVLEELAISEWPRDPLPCRPRKTL